MIINGDGPKGSVIIDTEGTNFIFNLTGTCNITFININFINGYAKDGGGIYHSGRGILNIKDCLFENNSAENGGAINSQERNMNIVDSKFINNQEN
ncbi:hypothetical protein ALNOE001_19660 [Candidatus Methanobinarius endosymbioticus]|uniref:Right handed beta helix domain-containing protein n=1 Tax=Candidatus Methanobinarius endosymbioticus TaxID=2006182 RepID=A0A366M9S2_9EURY|nr:hypothetical protein ALNOE001_19660 [Candidatus Methanobinarius endosymbioticus]